MRNIDPKPGSGRTASSTTSLLHVSGAQPPPGDATSSCRFRENRCRLEERRYGQTRLGSVGQSNRHRSGREGRRRDGHRQLQTFADRHAAARTLRRVAEVKAVALELDAKLSSDHTRIDTDIAAIAQEALQWNTLVPLAKIRLKVDHGWVTLQGEVEWDYQRHSAEKAIRPLMGVVGISNEVTLRASPEFANLLRKIAEALTR